jgi:hypothetical protein
MSEKTFLRANATAEAWLYESGAELEYRGTPNRNFIPLNDEAIAALALIAPLSSSAKNIAPRRGDPGP